MTTQHHTASRNRTAERLYALVANEEDARACRDIPDQACREVPRNFLLILTSLVFTKLGDLLINPKTVLPWLLTAVGAPGALVAWLVPVRESGSMMPQLVIGAWVRGHARRRGFWVLGSVLQGVCVLGMALAVWWLDGAAAGYVVLGLLVLFSLGRGLCSVAMKDVQGKTVPRQRRGRLTGLASTLSGVATGALGLWLFVAGDPDRAFYSALLVVAGGLWLLAALVFSRIDEYAGETTGGANALRQARASLALLRDDRVFRRFVISRALLLGSALSAPFFVVLGQAGHGQAALLGAFVLASALGSSLSATVWGYMADRSSRQVMYLGGLGAGVVCLLVGAGALLASSAAVLFWLLPPAYFLLSVAHAGVRIGRKTWLVDIAVGDRRTDYVSVSNTVIGVLLLVTGGISALASLISVSAVIILLGAMGLAGSFLAWRLPEAE